MSSLTLTILTLGAAAAQAQLSACPQQGPCVTVSVVAPAVPIPHGDAFNLSLQFQPGPSDGVAGELDEIAALTFSLGIPGLELADCSNPTADGLTPAITVSPQIGPQFRVIIENTVCDANPARPCLCPGAGQTRAPYVNVAIFGPTSGNPVMLPSLPAGELLSLALRSRPEAQDSVLLHVHSESDAPAMFPKPPFGAQASVGDTTGVDRSSAAGVSRIRTIDATLNLGVASTPTRTGTVTRTATASATVPPTSTPPPSSTATATLSPTRTFTAVPTATATRTFTLEPTATATRTPTATDVPTATATAPPTNTPVPPTATGTPVPTSTAGGNPTNTSTPAPTATATLPPPTSTATVPAPTATATLVPPTSTATGPVPPTSTPPLEATPTSTVVVPCPGDCNENHVISVAERVTGVRIALKELSLGNCAAFDTNRDSEVTVEEIVSSVKAAAAECR